MTSRGGPGPARMRVGERCARRLAGEGDSCAGIQLIRAKRQTGHPFFPWNSPLPAAVSRLTRPDPPATRPVGKRGNVVSKFCPAWWVPVATEPITCSSASGKTSFRARYAL